jgi:cytochrome c556
MALESKTLTLAEIGNLLMAPGRAYNQDQWMKDAQLLVDVGNKAYRAAQARNLEALIDLNAELYESCQSCHEHYRPGYRRR